LNARGSLLQFLGPVLLGLLLVVLLCESAPSEPREPFDSAQKGRLKKLRPDLVLLGNSMVNSRFRESELAQWLAPKRVAVIGVGGSKSAYWYLALKNVILPVTRPKEILLFYRRRELTSPRERAVGPEHHRLDKVTPRDDPFVEEKLAPPWKQPVSRLGWMLGRLAPVGRLHAMVSPGLDDFASATAGTLSGASERETSQRALSRVFDVDKLRPSDLEPGLTTQEKETFEEALPRSFLPAIIELVRGAGVKLTFVRVRTRENALGQPSRRRKGGYEDMLDRYVRQQGAEHLDLSGDEWETISLYGEGDHIAPRHRRRYTRLFVEHHREVFD
jgi:hypothetical protein